MCTSIRFTDKNGNMYWGRNLDWSCGYGQHVAGVPADWEHDWEYAGARSHKHDVIGMAVVVKDGEEKDLPLFFDCGNDAGLAVGGLNFPGDGFARYEEKPVEGKTNIAAYEFPLWVASEFASVDEVKRVLDDVAIVAKAPSAEYGVSLLHWHIADKSRSIVVEYKSDGMHVYEDGLDVLTNQPDFPWHAENVRNYMSLTPEVPQEKTWGSHTLDAFGSGFGIVALPGGFSSPSRFVRVAYLNSHYPVQDGEEDNVSRMFHTLAGVAMIEGGAKMSDGEFEKTIYTGGYSAASRTYYFNDYDNPQIRAVAMDELLADANDGVVASDVR